MRQLFLTLAAASFPALAAAQFEDPRVQESSIPGLGRITVDEEEYGYALMDQLWKTKDIPVCWENPTATEPENLHFIETVIDETWARYSALTFTGWEECATERQPGIHIRIANENPHVKALGAQLSGVPEGMVLNFEYDLDGFRVCNSSEKQLELCNRAIAVHEFGHALGLAHEHNRTDREETCYQPAQGTDGDTELTPYDPDSVMNYCNPRYGNYGKLSYFDVLSIRLMYGEE